MRLLGFAANPRVSSISGIVSAGGSGGGDLVLGLADVRVGLFDRNPLESAGPIWPKQVGRIDSADGRFGFDNLPAGTYWLAAAADTDGDGIFTWFGFAAEEGGTIAALPVDGSGSIAAVSVVLNPLMPSAGINFDAEYNSLAGFATINRK